MTERNNNSNKTWFFFLSTNQYNKCQAVSLAYLASNMTDKLYAFEYPVYVVSQKAAEDNPLE